MCLHPLWPTLINPAEIFEVRDDVDRFVRAVCEGVKCVHYGRTIALALLDASRDDATVLTKYGWTREQLELCLLPRTYHLRMEGAGL